MEASSHSSPAREYKLGKLLLLLVLSPYCTNSSGGPRVPCGDRWHSQIIQDLSNQSTTPLVSLVLPLLPAQRLMKNWVWDANSREHTRFHTTKKFNDLISIHLFQSKKRERSEHYLIELRQRPEGLRSQVFNFFRLKMKMKLCMRNLTWQKNSSVGPSGLPHFAL